mmetsp:Transcript_44075/g.171981  ORF Transcript_44075/g.171981 Transcript_44075/m.171981 type:complete len:215 (+) Transcript_44075:939-1583(+)
MSFSTMSLAALKSRIRNCHTAFMDFHATTASRTLGSANGSLLLLARKLSQIIVGMSPCIKAFPGCLCACPKLVRTFAAGESMKNISSTEQTAKSQRACSNLDWLDERFFPKGGTAPFRTPRFRSGIIPSSSTTWPSRLSGFDIFTQPQSNGVQAMFVKPASIEPRSNSNSLPSDCLQFTRPRPNLYAQRGFNLPKHSHIKKTNTPNPVVTTVGS